jgi:endonuclease YncB( thermonuclease family)
MGVRRLFCVNLMPPRLKKINGHVSSLAWSILLFTGGILLLGSCSASHPGVRQINSPPPSNPSSAKEPPYEKTSPSATFNGRVVSVEDGDTLMVLDQANRMYKIRLQGIDAPEGGQAFGDSSRQNLSNEVFDKEVTIEWSKRDRYRRIVGKILLNGDDLCLEQVRAGMAWHYKYYQLEQSLEDRKLYADAEDEARALKRGLWRDANPSPPWDFRHAR